MTARDFDRHRTLEQLEGVGWGEPAFDSYLVTECHRLRRKPLAEFTTEDLRIMIGQEIGLEYLVPLALEVLERDPLADGDFYPGDLLTAVTKVEDSFWKQHPNWHRRACGVLESVKASTPTLDEVDRETVESLLKNASPMFGHLRG